MKKQSFFTKVLALSLAMMVLFGALPVSAADVVEPSIQPEIPTEVVTEAPVVTETQGEVNPTEVTSEVEVDPTESIAPTEPEATPVSNIEMKCNSKADFKKSSKGNIYNGISDISFSILTESTLTTADALFSKDENATDFWSKKPGYYSEGYYTASVKTVKIDDKKYIKTRVVLDISASNDGKPITDNGTYYAKVTYISSDGETKTENYKIVIDKEAPTYTGFTYGESSTSGTVITCNGISDTCLVDAVVTAPDGKTEIYNNVGSNFTFKAVKNGFYTVVLKDELGNTSPEYTTAEIKEVDGSAPVIEKMTADGWSNGKKVTIIAKITDDGGSGLDKGTFMFDNKAVKLEATPDQADTYTFTVENLKEIVYTAEIKDNNGNTAKYDFNASDYVDTIAPSKDDFIVHFSLEESATDKILNLLTFGLYTNSPNLKMTVAVDVNGGSPIDKIAFKNASDESAVLKENDHLSKEGSKYKTSFIIKFTEEKDENGKVIKEVQNVENYVFYAVDKAQNSSGEFSLKDVKLTATGDIADATTQENYEFIYSESIPSIEVKKHTQNMGVYNADDIYIVKSDSGIKYTFNFKDDFSGLDVSTAKLYYGDVDQFTKSGRYYYPKSNTPIVVEEATADQPVTEKSETHSLEYAPTGEEGNVYVLLAAIANNCGNTAYSHVLLAYDNSAPILAKCEEIDANWANDKYATIDFTVEDLPKKNSSGISEIIITGDKTGEVDKLKFDNCKQSHDEKFEPKANVAQEYFITIIDALGNKSEKISIGTIKYDTQAPEIGDFSYSNGDDNYSNNENWSNKDVEVSFTVTDENEEGPMSGVKTVYVHYLDENGDKRKEKVLSEDGLNYSFTAKSYQQYTVTAEDNLGNVTQGTEMKTTEYIKIDRVIPEITGVNFESANNATAQDKLLNMLSFGLYSKSSIQVTINASDDLSGVANMLLEYDGKEVVQKDNSTELVYTLNVSEEVFDASKFVVKATDNADNGEPKNFAKLNEEGFVSIDNGASKLKNNFEVVVYDQAPSVDIYDISSDTTASYIGTTTGKYFADENITVKFRILDEYVKIHSFIVYFNDEDVTEYCSIVRPSEATPDQPFTDFEKHTGSKVDTVEGVLNIADLAEYVNKCQDGSEEGTTGCNTIKIVATGNNGVSNIEPETGTFYIDEQKPVITDFEFKGVVKTDKETTSNEIPDTVEKTNYGYFFKEKTEVTVSANDFVGSGVKRIYFVGVGTQDSKYNFDSESSIVSVVNEDLSVDYKSKFTVDAGFKGQIYAYAIDNVDNKGNAFYPDKLIVESADKHPEHSFASATVKTQHQYTDASGNPLFSKVGNGIDVELVISDTFSGLDVVNYGIYAGDDCISGIETIDIPQVVINSDAFNNAIVQYKGEGWNVVNDDNIFTSMTKIINIPTIEQYDHNNLTVKVWGTDNCGNAISAQSDLFNIDITAPKIEISYNDAVGNTYNDRTYYKDTRVATIVVRERNFDPDGFLNEIINTEGEKPVVVSEWQKTSSDDNNAEHTATVTFDKDGVFDVNFACFDMAKNSGEHDGEEFTIDTIDPVVSVTYDNNNASNGSYYAAGRTATITVDEHNFTADNAYVTYSPVATMPDNSTPMTPPSLSGWRSVGDTHTATITFNEDGKYEFTFDFKDLSLREAQQFKQEVFYVDTKIDNLKFNNVVNGKPYDGAVVPQIVFTDNNYSNATYTLKRISYDFANGVNGNDTVTTLVINETITTTGKTVTYNNFPEIESNDGIYLLSATIVDLAGNTKTEQITFSVNRFGSTFMLGNEDTEKLVENVYSKNPSDIVIVEINVNAVKDQSVSLSRNTKTVDLKNGKDFDIKSTGGSTSWYKYVYTIDKENFAEEGNYTLTVTSVDEFNKTVSNRTAQSEQENKTRERNCPVSFVVDKTAPVISIEGVEDGEATRDASRDIKIMCLDTNIDKESLVVKLDGEELSADEYTLDDTLVGELSVDFTVKSDGTQAKHNVEVYVEDLADNGANDDISEFTIAATLLTLYLSSTGAIIATIAVLIAAAIIIILVVRKKRKEA